MLGVALGRPGDHYNSYKISNDSEYNQDIIKSGTPEQLEVEDSGACTDIEDFSADKSGLFGAGTQSSISNKASSITAASENDSDPDTDIDSQDETIDPRLVNLEKTYPGKSEIVTALDGVDSDKNQQHTVVQVKSPPRVSKTIKLSNYLDEILKNLEHVYQFCFKSKYSGIALAGLGIFTISLLYLINPVLILPVVSVLTMLYFCAVFEHRVNKKLIQKLLQKDEGSDNKPRFSKRIKLAYILVTGLVVAMSLIFPALPILLAVTTSTTLMKIISNSDYGGKFGKDQKNVSKKCIQMILIVSLGSIATLVAASLLSSVIIFGIPLSFIASVGILACTMFINYYYRVAKDKVSENDEAVKKKNRVWKIGLVILNVLMAVFSVLFSKVKEIFTYLINVIKLNDAVSYFSIKEQKKKIIVVTLTMLILVPLILLSSYTLPVLTILSICLLLRKKMYEAFNLDESVKKLDNSVDKSKEIEYNKYDYSFIRDKRVIVWSVCISCLALGLLLLFTTTVSLYFFPLLILLMKLCDELYKKKLQKDKLQDQRLSVGFDGQI